MFSDISDRKRLEESLKEADRLKDEFLASVAHELRNLLAPVRIAASFLKAKGSSDPTLDQARGVIERQVEQMARLVGDLLDATRITRNRLELRRERTELEAVVQSAIEISRPLIDANQHELTVTLPAEPIYVDADRSRLAQACANLLNNAAKFTEMGGHIWLTGEQQGNEVFLRIKDTGIGIAAEKLASIFEMFSQVDTARGQSQGGLGIGLTLVRRLIEMHGGMIEARSGGLGTGSEFIVRLPVVSAAAEQKEARKELR
jgi:signal transduction histidine kinase